MPDPMLTSFFVPSILHSGSGSAGHQEGWGPHDGLSHRQWQNPGLSPAHCKWLLHALTRVSLLAIVGELVLCMCGGCWCGCGWYCIVALMRVCCVCHTNLQQVSVVLQVVQLAEINEILVLAMLL